jgi:acetamidase/formamidase
MIDFLVTEKVSDAGRRTMLTSVAADRSVTQLVDGNKGVHAAIPKSIFR